jgi:N-acetylglucosaminyl-diphospho-decaprenol L-rhamnosyltransferase
MADAIMKNDRPQAGGQRGGHAAGAARVLVAVADPDIEFSVVIVTWNSERWIERCLRSIPAACDGLTYEILLYDNASADATLKSVETVRDEAADDARASLRVMRGLENAGFATATNRAIAQSCGRYVFLLNPDCELDRGALRILHEFLQRNPAVAAAAPLLADERGKSQREFQLRRFPTLQTLAYDVLALDRAMPWNRVSARYRYRDLDLTRPQRIDQPAAAALLIRREVLEEVGPFDEQFEPAWFEDVDYCRRLAAQGKAVFVVPAARARHFGGSSLENLSLAEFTDAFYRNMWRYARKWLRPAKSEALRWIIIAGMLLRAVAALVGIAHRDAGRVNAFRAYLNVARKAFRRWSPA